MPDVPTFARAPGVAQEKNGYCYAAAYAAG
mgnify:CR=1 FL=1